MRALHACVVALALTGPQGALGAQAAVPSAGHDSTIKRLVDVRWTRDSGYAYAVLERPARGAAGLFTMVLKIDDGRYIPPHFHNVDKRVVVLQGTLLMGHGDVIDRNGMQRLTAGDMATVAAGMHHFEGAVGTTIVLLYSIGTLQTTFVPAPGAPAAPEDQ